MKRLLSAPLLAGAVSLTGLLLGWAPGIHLPTLSVEFGSSAQAQSVSAGEIRSYAQSVLEIEPYRQQAVQSIQNAGAQLPSMFCNQSDDMRGLNRQVRQVMVEYCTQSADVVQANGLSIERFNEITAAQQNDANLANQIRQALVEIRRQQGR